MTDSLINSRRTPVDQCYPSCESTFVELLIYLDGSTALVTELLDIAPSYSQDKGQLIVNSRGNERTAKNTYWCLSSENKVVSKDIRHHLTWLLNQLTDKEFMLSNLQRQPGVSMTVNCNWWSTGSGGPTIWPEQMSQLARLNLECTFDIYCSD